MIGEAENGAAIVLHSRNSRNGGKTVTLFSREQGKLKLLLPRPVMVRCGMGLTAPFALIRYSASLYPDYGVLNQYEGNLLFDMMKLSYEDMECWYFLIELADALFPVGEEDREVFSSLLETGKAGTRKNSLVVCFVGAVKLLSLAGFDPAVPEMASRFHLSREALELLTDFRNCHWEKPFGRSVPKAAFIEAAGYLDRFIQDVCDISLKTRGTFVKAAGRY